jgi:hypothetical protein
MKRRIIMLSMLIASIGILRIAESKTAAETMAAAPRIRGVKMELEGRPVPIYPMADHGSPAGINL